MTLLLPAPAAGQLASLEPEWLAITRELGLTDRERQVLRCIWHGWKFAAIAHQLGISPHTVETHWRHIKVKLNLPPGRESIRAACARIETIRLELRLKEATAPILDQLTAARAEIERLEGRVRELESASEDGVVSSGTDQ